ncbi:hypothetical protein HMPREF1551_02407 [Capnocytophaga sp. oral taxon 863 str. F0517]|nr:hypothetical protein HMPREF1551_02407 [Capnocytophaga sp. oral taxon 863 str. F0517]
MVIDLLKEYNLTITCSTQLSYCPMLISLSGCKITTLLRNVFA